MVEFTHLIVKHRMVSECLETVRETHGDVKQSKPVGMKFERLPLTKGCRARAHIDNHIPYNTLRAAHEFRLPVRVTLPVHTAHAAPARGEGFITLWPDSVQAMCPKFLLTIGSDKMATRIAAWLQRDEVHAFESSTLELHNRQIIRNPGSGMTKRPPWAQ